MLILVGIMGAIAVGVFDRLRLATMLTGNATGLEAARGFAMVGEQLVSVRIDDLLAASPQRTTLAGGWQGRNVTLPLPGGLARARVVDGGNCFNLNSLATGTAPDALATRPIAIEQFVNLMVLLDISRADAGRVAASAADWIDSDDRPNPDGAEDGAYAGAPRPYRAANTMMAEASELRAVQWRHPGDLCAAAALAVRAAGRRTVADQRQHAAARPGAADRHALWRQPEYRYRAAGDRRTAGRRLGRGGRILEYPQPARYAASGRCVAAAPGQQPLVRSRP